MTRLKILMLGVLVVLCANMSSAFVVVPSALISLSSITTTVSSPLKMDGGGGGGNDEDKLQALGYSKDEIRRSQKKSDPEQLKVRVDLVPDVDSFTLTAIGFGLIAFNFFVLANMGDGGIGGVVASIINTMNQ